MEQLELYQKIVAERDDLLREYTPGHDSTFLQQQDIPAYTPRIPELTATASNLLPSQQNDHQYQLAPNFLTSHNPYQGSSSQNYSLNPSPGSSVPSSYSWSQQQLLPPTTFSTSYQLKPDAYIDPFESLAKKAQESLVDSRHSPLDLSPAITKPYNADQAKSPDANVDSFTFNPAPQSTLHISYLPSLQNHSDVQKYPANLQDISSIRNLQSLAPIDHDPLALPRNPGISTPFTHQPPDALVRSQPCTVPATTSLYNTFPSDTSIQNPSILLNSNFYQPTTFPDILPSPSIPSDITFPLVNSQPQAFAPQNPQSNPLGGFVSPSTVPNISISGVDNIQIPTSISEMQVPYYTDIPRINPAAPLPHPNSKTPLANDILRDSARPDSSANTYRSVYGISTAAPSQQPRIDPTFQQPRIDPTFQQPRPNSSFQQPRFDSTFQQ